ncbi:GH39 family glycosyl hydrolase [Microbacterium sp. RD1]|uniref:GH39 family glycosyl hydrolase n=1 Tax=Microbacterium sp. RD1 TaxID=3457313 RepID=UPI003FA58602
MTTSVPRSAKPLFLRRAGAAAVGALALLLAACTPSAPQYPAQPDFAPILTPADHVPTSDSTPVTFTANYADTGAVYDPDQILNASQGGYAPMTNPRWFVDRLPQLSEMGIREVRIDHILNDTFYRVVDSAPDGSVTYDFTRLDAVVLEIIEQGMQPLLALSYTPSAFGKTHDVPELTGWTAAVTEVVSHYATLGYTGWTWEVWNEPDHDGWTAKQYNALYAASAPAVKAADPTARIGGATAAYFTSEGDISGRFIEFAAANPQIPVDFFSVHSYSSDNWDVVEDAESALADAGLDIPVLITEWALNPTMNTGPGFGSDSNSSPTGAAYVARRLALAAESSAERMFYFSPVEGLTYSLPYNGDLGLITVDGHRKSVGNVFEMYSHLGDTTIPLTASGAGTDTRAIGGFATRDSASLGTTVLLWNATETDAAATVSLEDLPYADKNVRVTQRVISGTQGNGYADSSTTVMPSYPSANENAPVIADEVIAATSEYSGDITVPAAGVVELRIEETALDAGTPTVSAEPAITTLASAASGAVATGSSSIEDPARGWSVASANDGRRYAVDVDESVVRGWSSETHAAAEATESLMVDLGEPRPVDSVSLWPYSTRSQESSGYPVAAEISGSVDGTEWEPLATLAGDPSHPQVSGEQTFSFEPVEVRYVKVTATTLGAVTREKGSYAFQLAEMEVSRTGVLNGGFESGELTGWTSKGGVAITADTVHRGQSAASLDGGASVSTEIRGLRPSTTYTVGAYVKASSDDEPVTLSATLPVSGSSETATSTSHWQHCWVTFTTDAQETSVTITVANAKGADAASLDDVTVSRVPSKKE